MIAQGDFPASSRSLIYILFLTLFSNQSQGDGHLTLSSEDNGDAEIENNLSPRSPEDLLPPAEKESGRAVPAPDRSEGVPAAVVDTFVNDTGAPVATAARLPGCAEGASDGNLLYATPTPKGGESVTATSEQSNVQYPGGGSKISEDDKIAGHPTTNTEDYTEYDEISSAPNLTSTDVKVSSVASPVECSSAHIPARISSNISADEVGNTSSAEKRSCAYNFLMISQKLKSREDSVITDGLSELKSSLNMRTVNSNVYELFQVVKCLAPLYFTDYRNESEDIMSALLSETSSEILAELFQRLFGEAVERYRSPKDTDLDFVISAAAIGRRAEVLFLISPFIEKNLTENDPREQHVAIQAFSAAMSESKPLADVFEVLKRLVPAFLTIVARHTADEIEADAIRTTGLTLIDFSEVMKSASTIVASRKTSEVAPL